MRKELKEEIYKGFLTEREIILNDDVTEDLIELVTLQIYLFNEQDNELEQIKKNYDRNQHPIKIFINTYGGTATECLSVISAIESSDTPVYTIALGKAYSAGFYILASGHRRFSQKYSSLMYHQLLYRNSNYRYLQEHQEDFETNKKMQQVLNNIIINHTNVTSEKLDEVNKNKIDWYMFADEALELGIVDEII